MSTNRVVCVIFACIAAISFTLTMMSHGYRIGVHEMENQAIERGVAERVDGRFEWIGGK